MCHLFEQPRQRSYPAFSRSIQFIIIIFHHTLDCDAHVYMTCVVSFDCDCDQRVTCSVGLFSLQSLQELLLLWYLFEQRDSFLAHSRNLQPTGRALFILFTDILFHNFAKNTRVSRSDLHAKTKAPRSLHTEQVQTAYTRDADTLCPVDYVLPVRADGR